MTELLSQFIFDHGLTKRDEPGLGRHLYSYKVSGDGRLPRPQPEDFPDVGSENPGADLATGCLWGLALPSICLLDHKSRSMMMGIRTASHKFINNGELEY